MERVVCFILFSLIIQLNGFSFPGGQNSTGAGGDISFGKILVTETYAKQNWVNATVAEGDTLWSVTTGGFLKWSKDGTLLERYYPKDGLMHIWSTALAIDSSGNKWIGSKYGCLSKFDGQNWSIFDLYKDWAGTPEIRSIVVDSLNNLWVAAGSDLVFFDGSFWTKYTSEIDGKIYSLEMDKNGILWLGTHNGVFRFDGEEFIKEEGPAPVYDIAIDENNNKWLAAGPFISKIEGYNNSSYYSYRIDSYLEIEPWIRTIEVDDGMIWLGSYNYGIIQFDIENDRMVNLNTGNSGLLPGRVQDIFISESGDTYFSTGDLDTEGGITRYNKGNWKTYKTESPFAHDFVMCLHEDQQQNIWAGTYGAGASMFDGRDWKKFPFLNHVLKIKSDTLNNIWFATKSQGIWKYNWEDWFHYGANVGLPSQHVNDIQFDDQGNLWFVMRKFREGEVGGAGMYDGENWTFYTTQNSDICSGDLLALAIDDENNVWFGSDTSGVSVYDGESFTHYNPPSEIKDIEVDGKGNIWVGTVGKQKSNYMYDGSNWVKYNPENSGIHQYRINSIAIDSHNYVWFGSGSGIASTEWYLNLSIYNGYDWVNFGINNYGIAGWEIQDIIFDSNHNFWIATYNGITKGKLKKPFSVEAGIDPNSAGSVEGEGKYVEGEKVTLQAIPYEGYEFVNWTDDEDNELSEEAVYSFEMPAEDLWFEANFNSLTGLLKEDVSRKIDIYPNPATEYIRVASRERRINKIVISNLSGSIVYNNVLNDLKIRISTVDFDPGVYVMGIYTAKGFYRKRFVVTD
ncbi:MAG: T9SS type A sorting domain-containing protein [Bacteroidales bacterium]|nr:T9SS type A sorting domain-containing protein [Bacteroidales bacterium]